MKKLFSVLFNPWLLDHKKEIYMPMGQTAEIVAEREQLMAAVSACDCVEKAWPSAANFFLVQVRDSEAVMRAARDSGILLRDFGKSLPRCIRITVGEQSENDRLLAVLAGIDGGAS